MGKSFGRVSPLATVRIFAIDWGLIAGAIAIALKWPGWPSFLFAQLVVASRQHALFLVMHEGAHGHLAASRTWNDRLSNWFAGWAMGFSTERFRTHHWTHHNHTNTDLDPDFVRKVRDPSWQAPAPRAKFWRNTLVYLFGKGLLEMSFAIRLLGIRKKDLPAAALYYSSIAGIITAAGGWKAFGLYWVLPFLTVLPLLHRVRNGFEHLALPNTNRLNGTRNIKASPIECFFFGPHHNNFHLVHHLYPFIPWDQVPAAYEYLRSNESFSAAAYENDAYFWGGKRSVYADMINCPSAQARGGLNDKQAA